MDFASHSSFCPVCLTLLHQPEQPVDAVSPISYKKSTISKSANFGCIVCFWVSDWLSTKKPMNHATDNWTITASIVYGEHDFENGWEWQEAEILRLVFRTSEGEVFQILLRAVVEEEDGGQLRLRPNYDLYGRSKMRICGSVVPTSTRNGRCLEQIKEWMHTCFHTHKLCHRILEQGASRTMPSRLIYIGDDGPSRLICDSDDETGFAGIHYISLSHRWQLQVMPTLITSNLELCKERIDVTDFPPVFGDAVEISKWLGVKHIWIDALCIIQNDKEDWRKEAAKMGRVYENAICNLGGHAAADQEGAGLCMDRDPRHVSLYPFVITRKDFEQYYYGYPMDIYSNDLHSSTLLHRGWVFQERLLSPRSVYFGRKLQWECCELQACEVYPSGGPAEPLMAPWGTNGTPFRVANMLSEEKRYQKELGYWNQWRAKSIKDVELWELHRKWLFIAEYFSRCQLTYEQDCFPALSGLARYFQRILKDEYVAGIWRGNFISGLIWYHTPNQEGAHLRDYRAPTWSWASVSPGVTFPIIHDIPRGELDDIQVAVLLEVVVHHEDGVAMGPVKDGFVCLSGSFRKNNCSLGSILYRRSQTLSDPYRHWIDDRKTWEASDCEIELSFFLISYRIKYLEKGGREILDLAGLILKPELRGYYSRIGVFHHEWKQERDGYTARFPPFIDFDPSKPDCKLVTIL